MKPAEFKTRRIAAKLSQQEVATSAGVHRATVAAFENDKYPTSLPSLLAIIQALETLTGAATPAFPAPGRMLYMMDVADDGVVTLTPAVLLPAAAIATAVAETPQEQSAETRGIAR